ncbi:MAG: polynucleotide adenylyltransferase PcnB [Spirochaetia bacterium]|nr:polynucleotide adenylyltransferase PcnB [Spirochaetia bacterium]
MLSFIRKLIKKSPKTADDILKYPQGKRYYQEFHNIRKNYIDPDALKVISRLNSFGYKAYIVGGCVRDLLLGRQPKDYDVVTNAKPHDVKRIFANSRLIGRRFKIVHIVFKMNKIIEVSTARTLPESRSSKDESDLYLKKDNQYGTFKEDAARRDFTINSLIFDIRNETIIDYTGGVEDLNDKIIRVIGDESISFPEDPVRMLRAVKFSALLDFPLHHNLTKGIKKFRYLINKSSTARLHEEYNKIFRIGQSAKIFKQIAELGLFEAMFPSLNSFIKKKYNKWPSDFEKTNLGIKLAIADTMIFEHEYVNTNIYYAILISPFIEDLLTDKKSLTQLSKEIRDKCALIENEIGLSKREVERLEKIFSAQPTFAKEIQKKDSWVKSFKNKDFFQEAFIYYKINARAKKDDSAIQKALFWEIGMRKRLPNAIRRPRYRPLVDLSIENSENR